MQKEFIVRGQCCFPIYFRTSTNSEEEAMQNAVQLFNNKDILQVEIEVFTKHNKSHIIICDQFDFTWDGIE